MTAIFVLVCLVILIMIAGALLKVGRAALSRVAFSLDRCLLSH
jgi:hypothetical protein